MVRRFVVVGTILVLLLSVAGCTANSTPPTTPLLKDEIVPGPKPKGKAG
jgi:hypothetical protein